MAPAMTSPSQYSTQLGVLQPPSPDQLLKVSLSNVGGTSATITVRENTLFCNNSPGTSPPSDVTAVQDGPTSIRVSWTPSSDATGYMIHYTSSRGHSGSEDVSGGHSDSHTLTGLVKEDTYTISITATSQVFSSSPIIVEVTLSEEDPLINS